MNIIEFAEEILDKTSNHLHPVQRVVLKLLYGIPLDDGAPFDLLRFKKGRVEHVGQFSEISYVERLKKEGRISGVGSFQKMVLICGRGSGKDLLINLIAAYEIFCQLDKPSQIVGSESFVFVGHTRDSTADAFDSFADLTRSSKVLSGRLANRGRGFQCFQRQQDIEESQAWKGSQRSAKASLQACVLAANPSTLRGRSCRFVGLNEFGAFPMSSAEAVLKTCSRLVPTLGGKLIVTGTPLGSDQQEPDEDYKSPRGDNRTPFRRVYEEALDEPETLTFRIPSWEMCAPLSNEEISRFSRRMESMRFSCFMQEYGAEFLDEIKVLVPASREPDVDLSDYVEEAFSRTQVA